MSVSAHGADQTIEKIHISTAGNAFFMLSLEATLMAVPPSAWPTLHGAPGPVNGDWAREAREAAYCKRLPRTVEEGLRCVGSGCNYLM